MAPNDNPYASPLPMASCKESSDRDLPPFFWGFFASANVLASSILAFMLLGIAVLRGVGASVNLIGLPFWIAATFPLSYMLTYTVGSILVGSLRVMDQLSPRSVVISGAVLSAIVACGVFLISDPGKHIAVRLLVSIWMCGMPVLAPCLYYAHRLAGYFPDDWLTDTGKDN